MSNTNANTIPAADLDAIVAAAARAASVEAPTPLVAFLDFCERYARAFNATGIRRAADRREAGARTLRLRDPEAFAEGIQEALTAVWSEAGAASDTLDAETRRRVLGFAIGYALRVDASPARRFALGSRDSVRGVSLDALAEAGADVAEAPVRPDVWSQVARVHLTLTPASLDALADYAENGAPTCGDGKRRLAAAREAALGALRAIGEQDAVALYLRNRADGKRGSRKPSGRSVRRENRCVLAHVAPARAPLAE